MHAPQFACVLGGVDLIRAIGLAGIPCASVSTKGALPRYSRFCRAAVQWHDPSLEPDALIASLAGFARRVGHRPVLFYQSDADTLFISRYRSELSRFARFVIPDETLVENLVDKDRFNAFAQRLDMPVPPSTTFTPARPPARDAGMAFPAIVKPHARQLTDWKPVAGQAKAVQVDSFEALLEVWQHAARLGTSLLVQRLVPGDETRIESYHVYLDANGRIVASFTGRKVRTFPVHYGHSTALELTQQQDVTRLGDELVMRMGLRGVAKLDFKRDTDGKLYLLEVNPRFNLWHHLGAIAGVNLPALVHADLTGRPRPLVVHADSSVGWSKPLHDLKAVRAAGVPLSTWVHWTLTARARSGLAADDPFLLFGWLVQRSRAPRFVPGLARILP